MTPRARKILGAFVAVDVLATAVARGLGFKVGGSTVVRCRRGHLFTTIWIPGASFKALRFGWWRFQRCPVGRHWSLVTPVRESALSAAELRKARAQQDVRLP